MENCICPHLCHLVIGACVRDRNGEAVTTSQLIRKEVRQRTLRPERRKPLQKKRKRITLIEASSKVEIITVHSDIRETNIARISESSHRAGDTCREENNLALCQLGALPSTGKHEIITGRGKPHKQCAPRNMCQHLTVTFQTVPKYIG